MDEKPDNGLHIGPEIAIVNNSDLKKKRDGQRMEGDYYEISSCTLALKSDEPKKGGDANKTATFADDMKGFELSHSLASSLTLNLDTPLLLIDKYNNILLINDGEIENIGEGKLSVLAVGESLTITLDGAGGEEQPPENRTPSDKKFSEVSGQLCQCNLQKSRCLEETANTDTEPCQNPMGDNFGGQRDEEVKVVQVNDGHKEFIVHNVDESVLARDCEATSAAKNLPLADASPLFQGAPGSHSEVASHSPEINNQDTIGPLENPAFLKTLQFVVSQPVNQEPDVDRKSNLDLRSLSAFKDPPDMDKGWAWTILMAVFLSNILLGSTIYAAGVLIPAILREVDPDLTKASWVGSVFVCSMCLAGPFVQIVLNQFGARITVFCASIVLTAGFIGASFARNISELILTHGMIGGIGAGFIASPMTVTVGQYFNRYRGLACGLMTTGAGVGMVSGGAVISLLLDHYGLSGMYLIWAGVMSHNVILGLLLRPSPVERMRALERKTIVKESHQMSGRQTDVALEQNQVILNGMSKNDHGQKLIVPRNINKDSKEDLQTPLLKISPNPEFSSSDHSVIATHVLPKSRVATPFQHHMFGRNLGLGDLRYTSLSTSSITASKTHSPPTIPSFSHYTLTGNVPKYQHFNSAHIVPASTLIRPTITSYFLPSTPTSACGLDKISQAKRLKMIRNFTKISNGDSEIPLIKSVPPHELSCPSQSLTLHWPHPRSHFTSPAAQSEFNHSFGIADLQHTSSSASPLATPKTISSPTVASPSQQALSNKMYDSSCHSITHTVAAFSDLTLENTTPTSPSSPASIHGPLAHSKIHSHRLSLGSLSRYTSMSRSSLRLSFRGSLNLSHGGGLDNESASLALVSQQQPLDAVAPRYPLKSRSITTLMGSVASYPTGLAIIKDDLARYESSSTVGTHEKGLKDLVIKGLDSLRPLRRRPFAVFLVICFLWAYGEGPVMTYLVTFAVSQGTTPMQASSLYTAMGTGSILGRFLSGLLATDSNIGPAVLYTGCIGVAGVVIALSPIITATVMEQVAFASMVGLYTGSLVPLSSLVVIDILDVGELGLGFGFITLIEGIGYLIGPPLASIIVEAVGFKIAFMISGFILIFASLMAIYMSALLNVTDEQELESYHGHALQWEKISHKVTDNQGGGEDAVLAPEIWEENISKAAGVPAITVNEMKDGLKVTDTILVETGGEVFKTLDHCASEEKLDPIPEVAGYI